MTERWLDDIDMDDIAFNESRKAMLAWIAGELEENEPPDSVREAYQSSTEHMLRFGDKMCMDVLELKDQKAVFLSRVYYYLGMYDDPTTNSREHERTRGAISKANLHPWDIRRMNLTELQEVEGIGKVRSRRLKNFVNQVYSPNSALNQR